MQSLTALPAYDLLAKENLAYPQAVLAQMREAAPVYRLPFREQSDYPWLLTRYDDAVWLHRDERFTKDVLKRPGTDTSSDDPQIMAAYSINRHLLTVDPPDHTRLRQLVHKAFTPRIIRQMEGRIEEIAAELLDAAQARGHMDLMQDYAIPLPITVICELLGVPYEDRMRFRHWTNDIIIGALQNSQSDAIGTAVLEFVMYFHQLFDQRRATPGDDLLSALVQAEESGDRLDQQELISMVFLLLVAGHETTVNLIGNGVLALLQHPDQLKLLRAQPALIGSAVEEMVRFNGPVGTSSLRYALEDIELHGTRIEAGDMVLASYLAANRDPEVFPDPDVFDITRDPNPHLGFGFGIHYCLGAPLARLEGSIAIQRLVERFPRLRLAVPEDQLEWMPVITLHGMRSMPVILD